MRDFQGKQAETYCDSFVLEGYQRDLYTVRYMKSYDNEVNLHDDEKLFLLLELCRVSMSSPRCKKIK